MIDRIRKEHCFGCGACVNACPRNCIEMEMDAQGFRYPACDVSACVQCGLCLMACPSYAKLAERIYEPQAYVCLCTDREVRQRSSSGGFFFAIAERIIQEGGCVFGVVGNWLDRIYHTEATTLDELVPMSRSKYLQSDVGYTYRQAKKRLEEGRQVLFSGTPCQIAGLRKYLKRPYETLYTIDLLCHGVPSETAFRAHVREKEERDHKKIVSVERLKDPYWTPTCYVYAYEDGTRDRVLAQDALYKTGYSKNLFQRSSCFHCAYARIPRVGDISIGDYFGKRQQYDMENLGLSVVVLNSEKGKDLFQRLGNTVESYRVPLETAVAENTHLGHGPQYNVLRPLFFYRFLKSGSFEKSARSLVYGWAPKTIRFCKKVRLKVSLMVKGTVKK